MKIIKEFETIIMKKTIKEILKEFNSLVIDLCGRRIDDFMRDLHEPVRNRIESYVDSLGLKLRTWTIDFKTVDYVYNSDLSHLFRYTLPGFIEDKRFRRSRGIGRIGKIVFIIPENILENFDTFEELTLQGYMDRVKLVDLLEKMSSLSIQIGDQKKSLRQSLSQKIEIYSEIKRIENEILSEKSSNE